MTYLLPWNTKEEVSPKVHAAFFHKMNVDRAQVFDHGPLNCSNLPPRFCAPALNQSRIKTSNSPV